MNSYFTRQKCKYSLQQLCIWHDEFLPVNKDQPHFPFREAAWISHWFLENLWSKKNHKGEKLSRDKTMLSFRLAAILLFLWTLSAQRLHGRQKQFLSSSCDSRACFSYVCDLVLTVASPLVKLGQALRPTDWPYSQRAFLQFQSNAAHTAPVPCPKRSQLASM